VNLPLVIGPKLLSLVRVALTEHPLQRHITLESRTYLIPRHGLRG
jgi:hypothetical protein